MSSQIGEKNILASFPLNQTKDWTEAAKKELNGTDPFDKLSFENEGIKIKPYYDQADVAPEFSFSLSSSTDAYLGARAWYNMPRIKVEDAPSANQKALDALNNGADGILFELQSSFVDAGKLFNKIDLNYCAASFLMEEPTLAFLTSLKKHLEENFDKEKISGSLFVENNLNHDFELFKDWALFKQIGVVVPESKAVEEIAFAIKTILDRADQLTDAGWKAESVFKQVSVLINITTDFFLSIAKLKALQIIWMQIVKAYDVKSQINLPVHVWCKPWIDNKYHPNGNMLKSTTAGLAAVLGGCHALTIDGEEENNTRRERIARNVSSLLREESHLSKVADPTAGSYYIDHLTNEIVAAAWEKIKSNS